MQEKYTYIFPEFKLLENGTYIITTKYKTSVRRLKGYLLVYPTSDTKTAFHYGVAAGFLYLDSNNQERFTRYAVRYFFNMFKRRE